MVLYVVTRLRKIKQLCIPYSVPDYVQYWTGIHRTLNAFHIPLLRGSWILKNLVEKAKKVTLSHGELVQCSFISCSTLIFHSH